LTPVATPDRSPRRADPSRLDIAQSILDLVGSESIPIDHGISATDLRDELGHKVGFEIEYAVFWKALDLLIDEGVLRPLLEGKYSVPRISPEVAKQIVRRRAETDELVIEKLVTLELGGRLDHARKLQEQLAVKADEGDCLAFVELEGRFFCELARLSGLFVVTQFVGARSDQLRVFHAHDPLTQQQMKNLSSGISELITNIGRGDALAAVADLEKQLAIRFEGLTLDEGDVYGI